jgi:hypothetical protein
MCNAVARAWLLLPHVALLTTPHQPRPDLKFPKRDFGRKTVFHQSFQHAWFSKWREDTDTVFCHTYLRMFKEKKTKLPLRQLVLL